MAGAAAPSAAAGAGGRSRRAHTAAGGALVAAALEGAHRHHTLDVLRIALGTVDRLVAPENQPLELLTTLAAFVLVNGHFKKPPEWLHVPFGKVISDGGIMITETGNHSPTMSISTASPSSTALKARASPATLPTRLTAPAGRISSPRLAGVGPKKMQKALPVGQ